VAPFAEQTLRRRRLRAVLFSLTLAACVTTGLAEGASATTQPGFRFTLQVSITDSAIRLTPHKTASGQVLHTYIEQGGRAARFPRGTLVQFVFTNHGTRTYLPAIRVTDASNASPLTPAKPLYTASHAISPGHQVSLFGNFYFRGSFQIEKLVGKKPQGQPIQLSIY
jgi:hypothetical protein